MALDNRIYKEHPLIHLPIVIGTDRGLQYCSNEYQKIMKQHHIKPSMTEKYDPYENAIAERVNGILKQEFDIVRNVQNLDLKKKLIKNAIEIYNNQRPHLSNHMLTPIQMHKQQNLKRKQYKSKKLNNDIIVQL